MGTSACVISGTVKTAAGQMLSTSGRASSLLMTPERLRRSKEAPWKRSEWKVVTGSMLDALSSSRAVKKLSASCVCQGLPRVNVRRTHKTAVALPEPGGTGIREAHDETSTLDGHGLGRDPEGFRVRRRLRKGQAEACEAEKELESSHVRGKRE